MSAPRKRKQGREESRDGGRGAPRKRRKRRLWISGTLGASPEWTPSEDHWGFLEAAYGKSIDDELRTEIAKAVQKYFKWATLEPIAPFADEFIKKLVKARKLAMGLGEVVRSFGDAGPLVAPHSQRYFPREDEEVPEGPADEDAGELFARVCAMPSRNKRYQRDFDEIVYDVYSVLDDTLRDVSREDAPAFVEGDSWKQLILDLMRALESRDFEVKASNDWKHQLSPFVVFVKRLQATFDEELRRHTNADALSSEINKVRREIRNRAEKNTQNQ